MASALAALAAAAGFVFSGDGKTAGSAERDLPVQAVSLRTREVVVGLHALPDAERAECGWYRVVPSPPPGIALSNEYWRVCGYAFSPSGTCARTYARAWRRVAPAQYSKLRLVAALKAAGRWQAVKAWIVQAGYEDEWAACQFLSADYPGFGAIRDAIVAAGVLTPAEAAAALEAARER